MQSFPNLSPDLATCSWESPGEIPVLARSLVVNPYDAIRTLRPGTNWSGWTVVARHPHVTVFGEATALGGIVNLEKSG